MTTETRRANATLRAVRMGLLLSQDDLARKLREAGDKAGEPNGASKRLVQRWESGASTNPRAVYARALEAVTGLPIQALGFEMPVPEGVSEDGRGGHDLHSSSSSSATTGPVTGPGRGNYSGIWLSRYEYFSSGRENTYTGLHYVVLLQHGSRITVRSLPGSSDSPLTMDLAVEGNVITGTWKEQTAGEGYYQGAVYHGAIQLLVEPTGRRMTGKWVGFGKEFDVNTGPWELVFKDASTNKGSLEKYNIRPE
ncbi:helix-turn-helix domain-containing protein [Streptomyces poriferorum]|uniref:Helix-turn-helix transcriptional regulator n=1 Tax=Streptomyces poriferorum TaxID=2798799 RepID=A0ABY9IUL7_9ACTN|nr:MULTISPECIES: helix-turn-helix transcriptional regulator [unclassified Streptomyces]MDP5311989.1 helix-turn-helix transcriptional regulator [Streptomyces sp. Alt4]WLQ58950.1 helix-turn-helix transcriptional regulator [Streptomyces sp. Alt2]